MGSCRLLGSNGSAMTTRKENAEFFFDTAAMLALAQSRSPGNAFSQAVRDRWIYPYPVSREAWKTWSASPYTHEDSFRAMWKGDIDMMVWVGALAKEIDTKLMIGTSSLVASNDEHHPLAPLFEEGRCAATLAAGSPRCNRSRCTW